MATDLRISNISKNGDIYTNFKPNKSDLNKKFLNETWKLKVNEISELLDFFTNSPLEKIKAN